MSLDGFIAKNDDDINFLFIVERPGEDYSYSVFQKEVDTLIWGRKTYDKVRSFAIDFPHKDKKCYVLSKSRKGEDENVKFYNGPVEDLISVAEHLIKYKFYDNDCKDLLFLKVMY